MVAARAFQEQCAVEVCTLLRQSWVEVVAAHALEGQWAVEFSKQWVVELRALLWQSLVEVVAAQALQERRAVELSKEGPQPLRLLLLLLLLLLLPPIPVCIFSAGSPAGSRELVHRA